MNPLVLGFGWAGVSTPTRWFVLTGEEPCLCTDLQYGKGRFPGNVERGRASHRHHRRAFPPGRPQSGDNERRVTVTPETGLPEGNEALLVRRDSPA